MSWLSTAMVAAALLMMTGGLLLMLDAGIRLARNLREEDHR